MTTLIMTKGLIPQVCYTNFTVILNHVWRIMKNINAAKVVLSSCRCKKYTNKVLISLKLFLHLVCCAWRSFRLQILTSLCVNPLIIIQRRAEINYFYEQNWCRDATVTSPFHTRAPLWIMILEHCSIMCKTMWYDVGLRLTYVLFWFILGIIC